MKFITTVAAVAIGLSSTQITTADNQPIDTMRATPATSSDMSDADVLAERHLALYRVSRAAALGLREASEDGNAVSVRTSATAALPLPHQPVSDSAELSAR